MLAALDSEDDISARSLDTTLLDFLHKDEFDHELATMSCSIEQKSNSNTTKMKGKLNRKLTNNTLDNVAQYVE